MTMFGDIHFALAFLVAICALAFSWNALGRRVMNVVLGLQVLIGIVLAAIHAASRAPLPLGAYVHFAGGFAALILYGAAARAGKRPDGSGLAIVLSILGLLCVGVTFYLGMQLYFAGGHV